MPELENRMEWPVSTQGMRQRNLTPKLRKCLQCGQMFQSSGPGRRVCPTCSKHRDELERSVGMRQYGTVVE